MLDSDLQFPSVAKGYGFALAVLAATLALIPTGCRGSRDQPPLGQVHGRVTLDGKPLPKAIVVFGPQEVGGRDSTAVTDANGEYVLKYIRDVMGGVLGENSVRITRQPTPDPASETLPAKYNKKTTLRADVKRGDNEFNFDLTSK